MSAVQICSDIIYVVNIVLSIVKWLQNKSRIIPVFEVSRCGKTNQQKRSIPMCTSINFTIIMQRTATLALRGKPAKRVTKPAQIGQHLVASFAKLNAAGNPPRHQSEPLTQFGEHLACYHFHG
ncbi:uncharacterized protein LOC115762573 [Drosophila novamexicana]|uniref:uncharacterized protein LOC115762573 n=1 Tax=Drosophila novamexicana TaxID=47314 RepID=UPI0011E5AAFF|nr:uncharacterized protein LOC115762573 [Drosophila novamexicana]